LHASGQHIGMAYRGFLVAALLSLSCPVLSQDSAIPYKTATSGTAEAIPSILLAFGIVCLVGGIVIWWLQRKLLAKGALPVVRGSHIKVLDRISLSTRTTAHVLSVDGSRLLICESPDQLVIHDLAAVSPRGSSADD
jgi:flagellar biogenesis protein FliO